MAFRSRALDEADARAVLAWRHAGEYAVYDGDPADEGALRRMLDPANGYVAVEDAEGFLGYYCVGPDARAPGVRYDADPEVLDLGVGVRPDRTGRGTGPAFVGWVLSEVEARFGLRPVRATIAEWNNRARRVAEGAGFRVVGGFGGFRHGGRRYVVMRRDVGAASGGPARAARP